MSNRGSCPPASCIALSTMTISLPTFPHQDRIALMDTETAQVYQHKNGLKMAGTGLNPQRYAIAMPLNSPTLQAKINDALTTLNNNGTLGALAKQYLDLDPNTAIPPSCVDDMAYVADVTYDDKNMTAPPAVTPGQVFVKTWRVKNTGTCSWVPGYQLAYAYGNTPAAQMGGQPVPITTNVAPGATVDLSATLTAPAAPGVYQGFWQMNNASKQAFGQTIWVYVSVVDPSKPTPAPVLRRISPVSESIQPASLGQCVQGSWSVEGYVDRIVFERNGQDSGTLRSHIWNLLRLSYRRWSGSIWVRRLRSWRTGQHECVHYCF